MWSSSENKLRSALLRPASSPAATVRPDKQTPRTKPELDSENAENPAL
jgi:hypothetical protein